MRSSSSSQSQMDRVWGALVIVCASAVIVALGARAGTSLSTIFRVSFDDNQDSDSKDKKRRRRLRRGRRTESHAGSERGGGSSRDDSASDVTIEEVGDAYYVYAHGARSVRRAGRAGEEGEDDDVGARRTVLHVGSCHCGGLMFEVDAPEHLVAIEGPSKVRYPFITVPAENFRLTSDDSNGSLYLLKCRPPAGRNTTPKVSAHFFCRRCGVHVVHAPDFPHAAVADVNVHCIRRDTIKSLAVGFMRGGGAELPGMGDPVEGMYEVNREAWSDAMRERVNAALQQQSGASSMAGSATSSRALSPRRRPSNSIGRGPTTREGDVSSEGRSLSDEGVRRVGGRADAIFSAGITAAGTRAAGEGPDTSTLRRNAEEVERARQRMGFSTRPAGASAVGTRGSGGSDVVHGVGSSIRPTGSTWGDVLMHVVSLPSGSSSSSAASSVSAKNGFQSQHRHHHRHHHHEESFGNNQNISLARKSRSFTHNNGHANTRGVAGLGSDVSLGRRSVRRPPRELYVEGREHAWGGAGASGLSLPPRASAQASRSIVGDVKGVELGYWAGVPEDGVRQAMGHSGRRSLSVDSGPFPHVVVSSPGAAGVAFQDGVDASGGENSSIGDKNVSSGSGSSGGGETANRPAPLGTSTENGARNDLEHGAKNVLKNGSRSGGRFKREDFGTNVARVGGENAVGLKAVLAGSDEDRSSISSVDDCSASSDKDESLLFARPPTAEGISGGYTASQTY